MHPAHTRHTSSAADRRRHPFASLLSRGFLLTVTVLSFAASPSRAVQQPVSDVPVFGPELAAATFDSVWSRIAHTHFDPEFGGVDWEGVRTELRPQAVQADSMDELRGVVRRMLNRLEASHFALLEGAASRALTGPDAPAGDAEPGVRLRLIDDQVIVVEVREGSPADEQGVRPGWLLLRAGELEVAEVLEDAHEALADRHDRDQLVPLYVPSTFESVLRGARGTTVDVVFLNGRDERVELDLGRAPAPGTQVEFGNLGAIRVETDARTLELPDGTGPVGLIRLSSWFPVVVPEIAEFVHEHRSARGIVFDLRGNPGGVGGLVMGVAGHLFDERVDLGEMTTRESTLRFAVNPQLVGPDGSRVTPYEGPVAVLVDGLSVSTSEIFSGGLQALGRARIFGGRTPGQALPAAIVGLPNGDRLMHAIADYTAPGDLRLEGRGVIPDESTPLTREALLAGRDPALEAALRWIAESPSNPNP